MLFRKPVAEAFLDFAWYNSCGGEKRPLDVNGRTSLGSVPAGGGQPSGFVNRAVTGEAECRKKQRVRRSSPLHRYLL